MPSRDGLSRRRHDSSAEIGRTPLREERVPFRAGDGLECHLLHVTGRKPPTRGPVLLVHGAGVRANIFRAPVATNFVEYLVDRGHDVWLENWRASIDLAPNDWTLDQAALHDHPAAVKTVVERTGSRKVKAVIHCQGSTSFAMSAMAGLVPDVSTIVTNAVSLHTVIPGFARFKIRYAVPLVGLMTRRLDPRWGLAPPNLAARLLDIVVKLTHRECDNAVCRWASFTYGYGFPTLWRHENLDETTHEWLKAEFGSVPISFFRQMARCVGRGHLVRYGKGDSRLPEDFAARAPETDARFAFFTGSMNRCFLPESQERSFAHFDGQRKGVHSLHVVPDYGHLDMFIGRKAASDVYPLMAAELEK